MFWWKYISVFYIVCICIHTQWSRKKIQIQRFRKKKIEPLPPLLVTAQSGLQRQQPLCVAWSGTAVPCQRLDFFWTSSPVFLPLIHQASGLLHFPGTPVLCSHCTWLITLSTFIPILIIFVNHLILPLGWKGQETNLSCSLFYSYHLTECIAQNSSSVIITKYNI